MDENISLGQLDGVKTKCHFKEIHVSAYHPREAGLH